jgi:flagellar basal body-associated protein FliL
MDCEKCGAGTPEGAETCPECGEALAAPAEVPAKKGRGKAKAATSDSPAEATAPVSDGEPTEPGSKRPLIIGIVIALVVVALGVGAFFAFSGGGLSSTPDASVTRMLQAYALYDAAGILAVSTHDQLQGDAEKEFATQAADAKKTAKGNPGVKDIKIVKVTYDAKDKTKATVEVKANWLVDPAKGEYLERTEKLPVVKDAKTGVWLVQLF